MRTNLRKNRGHYRTLQIRKSFSKMPRILLCPCQVTQPLMSPLEMHRRLRPIPNGYQCNMGLLQFYIARPQNHTDAQNARCKVKHQWAWPVILAGIAINPPSPKKKRRMRRTSFNSSHNSPSPHPLTPLPKANYKKKKKTDAQSKEQTGLGTLGFGPWSKEYPAW